MMKKNNKTTLHTLSKIEVKQNHNTKDQSSTIPEKNQPLSNNDKKKKLNKSKDDVPSVTQTSKQVNQKHKQNDEKNNKNCITYTIKKRS